MTASLSLLIIERKLLSLIHKPIISHLYRFPYMKVTKKKAFSLSPTTMLIETCSMCNLKCKMCPAIIGKYGQKFRRNNIMSMSFFKRIVDESKLLGFKHLTLNFYNEPLLDPLIFDRIAYAKDRGFSVSMFTNGILLTSDKARKLVFLGIDSITISIDSATKEIYEKIREGGNFYKATKNTLNLIKERELSGKRKPLIYVNMAITQDNIHEVKAFRTIWKNYANGCEVCPDMTMKFLPKILMVKGKYAFPCMHLWTDIVIMSDGRVPLCCMDYNCSVMLGDLYTQSLKEILYSKTLNKVKEMHLNGRGDKIDICKHCDRIYTSNAIGWIRP